MKTLFLSFLVLLSSIATCDTDDHCAADTSKYTKEGLKKYKPLLVPSANRGAKVLRPKLIQYGFQENVIFSDKTRLTYSSGGCAHFNFRFLFKGRSIQKVASAEKFDRAATYLKNLDLSDESYRNILLNALAEAKKDPKSEWSKGHFNLPCGDAYCQLTDLDDHQVDITYSFAL